MQLHCSAYKNRGPKGRANIRILQTMANKIPVVLGLRTRLSDPFVYAVFWKSDNPAAGAEATEASLHPAGC